MGLNLSVNDDVIASAVKESIVYAVAESLKCKDQLIEEFVKSLLTQRVRISDGQPSQYSSDKCCSKLEYMVRKALEEDVREEIKTMIEEQKPQIMSAIRSKLSNVNTQNEMVNMFIDSLKESVSNKYSTSVSFEFSKKKDY